MAITTAPRKRKAVTRDVPELSDVESEAEFGEGLLEGILSDSGSDNDSDEDEDEDEELESGEDELDNEGIPEEYRDVESEEQNATSNGLSTHESLQGNALDDDDKPNYTIEEDANGGERYVYKDIDPVVRSQRCHYVFLKSSN